MAFDLKKHWWIVLIVVIILMNLKSGVQTMVIVDRPTLSDCEALKATSWADAPCVGECVLITQQIYDCEQQSSNPGNIDADEIGRYAFVASNDECSSNQDILDDWACLYGNGDEPYIIEITSPTITTNTNTHLVTGKFYLKNTGVDMTSNWILEMQVNKVEAVQAIGWVGTQKTCNANTPYNVHKEFKLNANEEATVTLTSTVPDEMILDNGNTYVLGVVTEYCGCTTESCYKAPYYAGKSFGEFAVRPADCDKYTTESGCESLDYCEWTGSKCQVKVTDCAVENEIFYKWEGGIFSEVSNLISYIKSIFGFSPKIDSKCCSGLKEVRLSEKDVTFLNIGAKAYKCEKEIGICKFVEMFSFGQDFLGGKCATGFLFLAIIIIILLNLIPKR